MNNPLVSIVVPTKNEEKNIGRLLGSIKAQSYQKVEMIVVDAGSTDQTKEIARRFTRKVYNHGPERSAQRNYGGEKARGTYIVFLDADMELTKGVIEDCVKTAEVSHCEALIIPEVTVGNGIIPKVRRFEREMYMEDPTIEIARFFDKKVFFEFGGYDLNLTGPEDYDLPYRISKKYKIGRTKEYVLHHEENLTLPKLLKKKYYYANRGHLYASKHPELIFIQGTIIFRKAYLKHWRKFLRHPIMGITFIFVRILETTWAVTGYVNAVGPVNFLKTFLKMLRQ